IFIINIWRGYLRNVEKNKVMGAYIMLATHVAYIPIFIITVDWGRWLAGLLMFEFLLIMYLWAVKEPAMVNCLQEKWEKIKRNPLPYLLMLILVACQGKFDAIDVSASAKRLVDFVEKWIEYIFM
ncbi:MAG: hypothetical protein J6I64_05095, partial [Lachnospiraceae bacterium]|nr:hypothetical protein [Lachnospiraceae bacterium]